MYKLYAHNVVVFVTIFWLLFLKKNERGTLIRSKKKNNSNYEGEKGKKRKNYVEKYFLVLAELRIRVQIMHVESSSALLASRASMSS
jgi:hypothetical protein